MTISDLADLLDQFANERDWRQYHTPKNLAMALAAEAGELLHLFEWVTPEESENPQEKLLCDASLEMADVLIYLVRLADIMGVDLLEAARRKIDMNANKYPAGVE